MRTIVETKFLDNALKFIPLLPVLGFLFAFSYEGTFLYFLDVDPFQLLDFSDLARISAFYILPAIPFMVFGAMIGWTSEVPNPVDLKQYARNFILDLPYKMFKFFFWFAAFSYLFLGLNPDFGIMSMLVLSVIFLFTKFINLEAVFNGDSSLALSFYVLLLFSAICAGIGANEAMKIRSGELESFAVFDPPDDILPPNFEYRLVRNLSDGVLVVDYSASKLLYTKNGNTGMFRFELDTIPFRGILCYTFDICHFSGWTIARLREQ